MSRSGDHHRHVVVLALQLAMRFSLSHLWYSDVVGCWDALLRSARTLVIVEVAGHFFIIWNDLVLICATKTRSHVLFDMLPQIFEGLSFINIQMAGLIDSFVLHPKGDPSIFERSDYHPTNIVTLEVLSLNISLALLHQSLLSFIIRKG